ncbi:hypothetical protein, partial [Salmonella sp. s59311]|uniref:hypothetical protein n=1 Tax=Salmonella sp. s59311 TaxID=3159715 RepID=UPI003980A886
NQISISLSHTTLTKLSSYAQILTVNVPCLEKHGLFFAYNRTTILHLKDPKDYIAFHQKT